MAVSYRGVLGIIKQTCTQAEYIRLSSSDQFYNDENFNTESFGYHVCSSIRFQ